MAKPADPPPWLVVLALPVLATAPIVAFVVEPIVREVGLARSWFPPRERRHG